MQMISAEQGRRWLFTAIGAVTGLLLVQCAPLSSRAYSKGAETFGYRKWEKDPAEVKLVVIGLHGFCGASIDYQNLGRYLTERDPRIAVYAYELRGQGRDPKQERRGDIEDPSLWYHDLEAFTTMVRERHPQAKIIWYGESMGSLIVSHAYQVARLSGRHHPCDGLVLSSPVVKLRDDFPGWKKELIVKAAEVSPMLRISTAMLAGGQSVPMTHNSFHDTQATATPWNVDSHTLRLLVSLSGLIETMPECGRQFREPTLILNGGRDFFSQPKDISAFYRSLPRSTPKHHGFYKDGYHLLMYDNVRNEVFSDVQDWLEDRMEDSPR
jgi:alpha-beta hydrolase superfamily lysophospholipase